MYLFTSISCHAFVCKECWGFDFDRLPCFSEFWGFEFDSSFSFPDPRVARVVWRPAVGRPRIGPRPSIGPRRRATISSLVRLVSARSGSPPSRWRFLPRRHFCACSFSVCHGDVMRAARHGRFGSGATPAGSGGSDGSRQVTWRSSSCHRFPLSVSVLLRATAQRCASYSTWPFRHFTDRGCNLPALHTPPELSYLSVSVFKKKINFYNYNNSKYL